MIETFEVGKDYFVHNLNGTETASGQSSVFDTKGKGCVSYIVTVSAVSGTAPKLQLHFQISDDQVFWTDVADTRKFTVSGSERFAALRAAGRYFRFTWNIEGTAPSFTFSISAVLKEYLPNPTRTLIRYQDIDLTSLGNTSSIYNAADTKNISFNVARDSVGLGTALVKVQASNDQVNWVDVSANISFSITEAKFFTMSNYAFRFYRLYVVGVIVGGKLDIFFGANT